VVLERTREAQSNREPRFIIWSLVATFIVAIPTFWNRTDAPALENWSTIFLALVLQALPFLVLGVTVSALLSTFVEPGALARLMPKRPELAVPIAAVAAAALPGCECSSVPVAGRLLNRGVPAAAALTFMLAAPAINPVVLVATAVAFPGRPEVMLARLVASFIAAVVVGLIWARRADSVALRYRGHEHTGSRVERLSATASHDFVQAGGFLVIGAALVATMQTVIPSSTLTSLGGSGIGSTLLLALLAVVLSVCSEADAFVAAGLVQFSLTARLVFLVVGPMIDVKLIAMQAGSFGTRFALRFGPLTFVVAVASALVVGRLML
jgi:uncharacterized membrane protein YraQ (UPF0718 family)